MQRFWLEVVQGTELLPLGAFLHKLYAVTLDGRQVIINPENFGSHRLCFGMVSADSFMDFLEDILCLLFSDAL